MIVGGLSSSKVRNLNHIERQIDINNLDILRQSLLRIPNSAQIYYFIDSVKS